MARGACAALHTDMAVALSGVAGPDGGSPQKPVGTVFIGLALRGEVHSTRYLFAGDRQAIREAAVQEALRLMTAAIACNQPT